MFWGVSEVVWLGGWSGCRALIGDLARGSVAARVAIGGVACCGARIAIEGVGRNGSAHCHRRGGLSRRCGFLSEGRVVTDERVVRGDTGCHGNEARLFRSTCMPAPALELRAVFSGGGRWQRGFGCGHAAQLSVRARLAVDLERVFSVRSERRFSYQVSPGWWPVLGSSGSGPQFSMLGTSARTVPINLVARPLSGRAAYELGQMSRSGGRWSHVADSEAGQSGRRIGRAEGAIAGGTVAKLNGGPCRGARHRRLGSDVCLPCRRWRSVPRQSSGRGRAVPVVMACHAARPLMPTRIATFGIAPRLLRIRAGFRAVPSRLAG